MSESIKNISKNSIFGCLVLILVLASSNRSFAQDTITSPPVEEYIEDEEEEDRVQTSFVADTPVIRNVPPPVVDSLKNLKAFEYANDPEYWLKEKEEERKPGVWDFTGRITRSRAFKWIIIIILGALLLWALYTIIVSNNLFLFSRSKKLKDETVEEDIQLEEATLDQRIANLISEKNYRPAIRYLYIKVLQQLNEKGWITYHAQATNFDYIRQMSKSNLSQDFRFLTQVYEYVWYGEFAITDEQFTIAHNRFNHFLNRSKPWEER